MTLPTRKWYSVSEAVDYLNNEGHRCTLSDLLHFATTGAIQLLTNISGSWRYQSYEDCYITAIQDSVDGIPNHLYMDFSRSSFLFKSGLNGTNASLTNHLNFFNAHTSPATANPSLIINNGDISTLTIDCYGFMGVPIDFLMHRSLTDEGIVDGQNLAICMPQEAIESAEFEGDLTPEEAMHISFFIERELCIEDLFITHSEIEILINGGREQILSIQNLAAKKTSQILVDTRSTLPSFIDDLLFLYYRDESKRGKSWLHVREKKDKGEPTELENDFEKAGLTLPSQKTIKRWLHRE